APSGRRPSRRFVCPSGPANLRQSTAISLRNKRPYGQPNSTKCFVLRTAAVAFEMARGLRALGQDVELLALLETDLHPRYLPLRSKIAYQLMLLRRVAVKSRSLAGTALPAYLWSKIWQLGRKLLVRLRLRDYPVAIDEAVGPMTDRFYLMFQLGVREFMAFDPAPYDGVLSYFRVTTPRY